MTANTTDVKNIDDVFSEVKYVLSLMYPDDEFNMFTCAYTDILHLFDGKYDGYKACNTPFHDLQHTLDCLLAMIRLLHGAFIDNLKFPPKEVELGLIAALMHDTGYIQTTEDIEGSGAKYTLVHVRRSAEFLKGYFKKKGYSDEDAAYCMNCINYTGLGTEIEVIKPENKRFDIMGQMLGTADLVGQMADHAYLEKLLFLAKEFKEGQVPGYEGEDALLLKTKEFYLESRKRLKKEYGSVARYLKTHFRQRWDIDRNVYLEAIQNQISYLEHILNKYPDRYHEHLRRGFSNKLIQTKNSNSSSTK